MKRLVLPLVLAVASPASAQSFLEHLARGAVADVAAHAASTLGSGPPSPPKQEQREVAVGPAPAAAVATGPSPWPNNLGDPRLRRPGQLKFDPALEAQKDAFRTFGEVSCRDCEGGVSFDTAAKLFLDLRDMWAFDSALGALEVGQSLTWRGRASMGRITAVSDAAVGPFPCKQLRWELKRGEETRTRDGLVCKGKSNPDADNDRWIEVL